MSGSTVASLVETRFVIVYSSHPDWISFLCLDLSLSYIKQIPVKYGNECGDRVMEFSSNNFTILNDVIEKTILAYGKCCILQLFNEHGRELDSQEIVENARVYMVKRRAR